MKNEIFIKKQSDTDNTISRLKTRTNSIYIYGKDSTAMRAYNILKENNVVANGFFVDDKYYNTSIIQDLPVYTFSQVMSMKNVDIVIGFYQFGLAYQRIKDNYFTNDGEVFFISPAPLFDFDYYEANKHQFIQTYEYLQDDLSKDTMLAYMDGRMNGVMYPMYDCYTPNQYFIPEVSFKDKEVFIDCGMYDGDTIVEFMSRCKDFDSIIGFEPDIENINKFKSRSLTGNIEVINKGVWSKEDTLYFQSEGTTASKFSDEGDVKISVTSIDSLKLDKPVTFIKMDIEGSELEALKGAKNTIIKYHPTLAICVYHKKEDLITIPQYIKSLEQDHFAYTFILRHHSLYEHETVLYAIPTTQ